MRGLHGCTEYMIKIEAIKEATDLEAWLMSLFEARQHGVAL